MKDVLDLAAHLNVEPPEYRIMSWRFLPQKPRPLTEREAEDQHRQLSGMLEQAPLAMPAAMKDHLRWAAEMEAKLKPKKEAHA